MKRLLLIALVVLAMASQAAAAPLWGIGISRVCEGAVNQVRVFIYNNEFDHPDMPVEVTVIRRTTVPGLSDPVMLTETPIPMPAFGEETTVFLTEPDLPADAIGYYEGWAHWESGDEMLMTENAQCCTDNPYIMRGYMITEYLVAPCADIGLMECTEISIVDPEFMQYIDTGELLDIYGWPVWINDVEHCGITITDIVPLGDGATCSDPVGTHSRSWSSVKGLFD